MNMQTELQFDELKINDIKKEVLLEAIEDLKFKYRDSSKSPFYRAGIWDSIELLKHNIFMIGK